MKLILLEASIIIEKMREIKTMKKLTVILTFCFLACLMVVNASAMSIVISADGMNDLKVGDTLEIPVNISDNKGFAALSLLLEFDSDKLELTEVVTKRNLLQGAVVNTEYGKGQAFIGFASAYDETKDGTLFVLKFRVIKSGIADIGLAVKNFNNAANEIGKDDTSAYPSIIPGAVESSCTHTMSFIPAIPAACQSKDIAEYYHCTSCDKNFADEAGSMRSQ